jgi:ATP-dependent DNA helicase RecQ
MPVILAPNSTETLHSALRDAFEYDHFRPLQQEAVQAALVGRDALVVMPTGAGKSLCFQLPAFLTPGVTLVVSPLIALMRDQVDALNRRPSFENLGCAGLHSGQSLAEQRRVLDDLRCGEIRLLYVAPERFRSSFFLNALRNCKIVRLVVDEAHCISEWGHDFRPDYLSLKDVVATLGNPPVTAVTATATRRVQESIVTNLGMADPLVLVGGFNRPNLHLSVHRCKNERERLEKLARALPKLSAAGGSGLIYVATRKQCEELAELASEAIAPLGQKAGLYHAGLDAELRTQMQQEWLAGKRQVLVCTNAFGMGIDKPDVRFVVHCACPDSIESYYQEAGRAGRDGLRSRCVILYHFTDRKTREWFIDNDALTPADLQSAHRELASMGSEPRLARNWGMRTFGWSDVKTRLALGVLERSGLIERVGETSEEIALRLKERQFPPEALHRITEDLQRQRRERYRRLDEMTDYCKTQNCRRQTILDYFGDQEPLPPTTFCCDNCSQPAPSATERRAITPAAGPVPMPETLPAGDLHALLQGLDSLRPSLGRARLGKLLRGSASKDTVLFQSQGCPLFGALRGVSREGVYEFLDRLIADGLLRQGDEDEYFVCAVTQRGRDAWQERQPLDTPVPGAPRPIAPIYAARVLSSDTEAEPDAQLYHALRHWRRLEASSASLPPYCIFSDRTLTAIARGRPRDLSDLRAIPGIGDTKLEKYGAAVLQVLAQHV